MPKSVLLIHNKYIQPGGEETVFAAERRMLEEHGAPVTALEWSNAGVDSLTTLNAKLGLAVNTLWSREAAAAVRQLVHQHAIDIAHVHNTFPRMSPSVYSAARDAGAAVVQTLHNFRLLCPNGLFFRAGQPCQDCLGRRVPWPGVVHACYRDSRAQTGVSAAMLTLHRARRTWDREVDLFIALSDFSRKQFIAGGLPADRIVVKPNFLPDDPGMGEGGESFLYVGRFDPAKGIQTLAAAMRLAGELPLTLCGTGPLETAIRGELADSEQARFLGQVPRATIFHEMRHAKALILPSRCYENFPMTLVEAFARGLPVIASRHGAMEELVTEGQTGLLFEPGNAADLAAKMRWANEHPAELRLMGANARQTFLRLYTSGQNIRQLTAHYEHAMANRHARSKDR